MENIPYDRTFTYGTCASSESYIRFLFMYTTDHIFPVLPIKDLINEDADPTMAFKLVTGTKPSISHLRVFFVHVLYKKLLNMLVQRC